MMIHIVMKGYSLMDENGGPCGTVRANPTSVHLSLKKAINEVTSFDFAKETKAHACNGFREGINTSDARTAVLTDNGRDDCFVKIWICSRNLEV